MREILFRGKRIDNGEWVEGYYVYDESGQTTEEPTAYILCLNKHPCGWSLLPYMVDPETVGQYIGLTANGTKIFEGDIFEDRSNDAFAIVIFKDGCFRLEWYGMRGGGWGVLDCDPIDWYCVHEMKIVGNVHDNPEVLKGE